MGTHDPEGHSPRSGYPVRVHAYSNQPGGSTRPLYVSPAGDAGTGVHIETHGKSAHGTPPAPPAGHFKMNHDHTRTFLHDSSPTWDGRVAEVPEPKTTWRGGEPAYSGEPAPPVGHFKVNHDGTKTYHRHASPAPAERQQPDLAAPEPEQQIVVRIILATLSQTARVSCPEVWSATAISIDRPMHCYCTLLLLAPTAALGPPLLSVLLAGARVHDVCSCSPSSAHTLCPTCRCRSRVTAHRAPLSVRCVPDGRSDTRTPKPLLHTPSTTKSTSGVATATSARRAGTPPTPWRSPQSQSTLRPLA